jgi:hypothetical protein
MKKHHRPKNPLCACAPEPMLPVDTVTPAAHEFSWSCACEACVNESTARTRARLKAAQVATMNFRR